MYESRARWQGRSKLIRGRCCRLWGRVTGNPDREFQGEQLIIAGKLEAYYARGRPQTDVGPGGFIDRRRSFYVVA